jgi:DNA (cytosine-5)-methyltransferase 3A
MKGKSVTLKSQAGGGGGKTGLYLYDGKVYSLTSRGAEKLQTVPVGYTDCVPKEVAISLLGNGWTVEVIKHQLSYIPNILNEEIEVLSMYDGMSCGQIALREMGCNVVKYYATEIDPYAIKTTQHNFPDTIQLGDAFQVREADWRV